MLIFNNIKDYKKLFYHRSSSNLKSKTSETRKIGVIQENLMMEPGLTTKEKLPSFVSLRLGKEYFMKALFLWFLEPLLVEYILV